MWRSNVSQGAIVPSARTSKFASVPADARLGPVGVRGADVAPRSRRSGPADEPRRGERSPGTPPSRGTRALGSSQPPSTQTIAADGVGMPRARARGRRCRPTTGRRRSGRSSSERRDQGSEVVGDGRHVVRAVGLGRAPVAAQVDRDAGVSPARRAAPRRRPTSGRSRRARGRAGTREGLRRHRLSPRAATGAPPCRARRRGPPVAPSPCCAPSPCGAHVSTASSTPSATSIRCVSMRSR